MSKAPSVDLRIRVLAAVAAGASHRQAAERFGVARQIIRDWVVKFNELAQDGLLDRKQPGQLTA